jgi:integrase
MPKHTLNDRFIASCKTSKRVAYFDTKCIGLVLRVSPAGSKTWLFVYRKGGAPEWLTLGSYPAMTLAEARKLALGHRHSVDVEDRNPAEERRQADQAEPPPPVPAEFSFGDLCDVYLKLAPAKKKTWIDDRRKITKYLRTAWGARPLKSITRSDVHALLDMLVAAGLTVGVNRVQALISRLFTVAMDRSLIDAHPAARMEKRFKERPSDRVLTDDELKKLWAGLDAQPGRASDAIRLRLLLGQRGEETAWMTWSEVDLEGAVWQMAGTRTKNGRPHAVPLPATALALLKRRRGEVAEDEPTVFDGLTLAADDYRALSTLTGGTYEWPDLRRTVATRLAGLGFDETTIGRVLNHARATVTSRHYNQHAYLDEKTSALAAWDRELRAIVTGKREKGKMLAHRPRRRA